MEADSEGFPQDLPQSIASDHMSGVAVESSDLLAACVLCRRILSPDNEATGDLEAISICGDCKFLYLEDFGSPAQDSHRRRPSRSRGRRTRYSSSESVENVFSQQFSHMLNMMRQNQASVSGNDDQPVDGDAAARLLQRSSSRTTPSGSRRWRRVLSDTESDGFENLESIYGDIESNASFGGYRVFHGESDAISFSAYGGESDVSVDGHSFLDTDLFIHQDEESDLDSDTDIDPMHAGLNQWNSDDQEEEEEEEVDDEWEDADAEENAIEPIEVGSQAQNFLSNRRDVNNPITWRRQLESPDSDVIRWRIREGRQTYLASIFSNLNESEVSPYRGNSGNYLDATDFEALLEHLAETDSSRRGAPPAAVSFVNSLPRIVVNEEHAKQDDLACAICKDLLSVGIEVIQMPCLHLYHPFCILPWLSTRNSCPLCRYELPTDDKDYEEGKWNNSSGMNINEMQQHDTSEDSSSDGTETDEAREFVGGRTEQGELLDQDPVISSGSDGGRGRWFLNAAGPIVSLVGIALVLWFGTPLMEGRGLMGSGNFHVHTPHQIRNSSGSRLSQRENRGRRWWSLF